MDFSDYKNFFAGKKVTLLGLGLLGRGVGDAEFLAQCGAQVLATDLKSATELAPSVDYLKKKYPNIVFRLGAHELDDFTTCDMVIKAAGVPLNSSFIAAAHAHNIPVYMSGALFAKFAEARGAVLVGVTGTRGKTTITHMIHHVLEKKGVRTMLGGNIRGLSTLSKIVDVRTGDIAVLELDSWQLQGFGDLAISPHIAIFSNLMPDHLNYYPDMQAYFNDKAHIFRHQKPGDVLYIDSSLTQLVGEARPPVAAIVPPPIPNDWILKVAGEHNRSNAAFAAAALKSLGLTDTEIRAGLESFEGVEGRFQHVKTIDGIAIINDNNATTPMATLAALNTVPHDRTVLIMGGSDKGLDMHELVAAAKNCKKVILLAGTGSAKIAPELPGAIHAESLASAIESARFAAQDGDTILFSPAFASFGMFKNEYDRNDQFLELVKKL